MSSKIYPSRIALAFLACSAVLPLAWLLLPWYYTLPEAREITINGSPVWLDPMPDRRSYLVLLIAVIPHLFGWYGAHRLLTLAFERRLPKSDLAALVALLVLLLLGLRPLLAMITT